MTEQDSYAVMPLLAKILLGPGSPDCHRAGVQLIAGQEHRALGRDGKVEKGSISAGALLLALVITVVLNIFISLLQKAVQETTRGKANTAMAK